MLFSNLLKERLRDYLASHPNVHEDTIRIKISRDGARMTCNFSFILMSFALPDLGDDVMVAKGNHTIAVVKGKENYSTLQESFGDVFLEINKLNSEKKIKVNDRVINLEFFLGGDYKFILLMMGLKGAMSYYACVRCKVHKNDRLKMDLDLDYYHSSDLKRTLKEMNELAQKQNAKEKYCCEHKPLVNIEMDHVILDELHLLLRIIDIDVLI